MTTLIMPSDYGMEMLVGSSPVLGSGFMGGSLNFSSDYSRCSPMWSHSPPANCHTSFGVTAVNPELNEERPSHPLTRRGSTRKSTRARKLASVLLPSLLNLKSCLVSRAEAQSLEGELSPTKEKKKVSFADMLGGNLTHIKIITEKPDCPPVWSQDFLEQVTGGAKAEAVPDQWALTFPQPASDYMLWKTKLERDNIALENVVINEPESLLAGTIKVRNLSFNKEVIVRYSINNWFTHDDAYATFVQTPSMGSSYNIYDTFKFELPLPVSCSSSDKMEFCLNYNADGQSFWDNNSDKNYSIISFQAQKQSEKEPAAKPSDLYDLQMNSWSEFSAWNNLDLNESPYW